MSSVTTPTRRPVLAIFLAAVLGGLVVLVVGGILIAADVIDTGEDDTVVRESTVTRTSDADGGRDVTDIYRDMGPGVVFIEARGVSDESPFGLPQEGNATGSGFVIDKDGFVLTNAHVVEGTTDVTVRFGDEGKRVDAEVKGRDPSSDLALLKVDPDDVKLDPVPLGDSSKAQVGDPVVAIGNPFGFEKTVTTGIVSAVQRQIQAPNGFTISGAIQTDASINPGNSGGPLLDARGRVMGINSQIATGGGQGSVGIGFAVPVNTAKDVVSQLKRSGEVDRPFIGVETTNLTEELAKQIDVPVERGAVVVRVGEDTPADEGGLRSARLDVDGEPVEADVIVRVAGRPVRDSDDIAAALQDKKPNEEVTIEFFRGEERKRAKVKLDERPEGGLEPSRQEQQEPQQPLIP
jgi:S1-C subfamily serine protease